MRHLSSSSDLIGDEVGVDASLPSSPGAGANRISTSLTELESNVRSVNNGIDNVETISGNSNSNSEFRHTLSSNFF